MRHFDGGAPVVEVRIGRRLLRDVVAVVDDDRIARELFEVFERNFVGLEVAEEARGPDGRGHLALREREVAPRFIGSDPLDAVAHHAGEPADAAALGVRDENGVARLLKHGRHRAGVHLRVIGRGVGGHLAEELVEGLRILRELRVLVELGPHSHSELPEEEGFVGFGGDFALYGRLPGASAARLVDEVDLEAA